VPLVLPEVDDVLDEELDPHGKLLVVGEAQEPLEVGVDANLRPAETVRKQFQLGTT
jgi:hypothetical protein